MAKPSPLANMPSACRDERLVDVDDAAGRVPAGVSGCCQCTGRMSDDDRSAMAGGGAVALAIGGHAGCEVVAAGCGQRQ